MSPTTRCAHKQGKARAAEHLICEGVWSGWEATLQHVSSILVLSINRVAAIPVLTDLCEPTEKLRVQGIW